MVQLILERLAGFGPVLTIKLYRLAIEPPPPIPIIPCLDHEAMLHHVVAPHAAVYLQESASGAIHELTFVPDERRIEVDTVSTWGECSPESRQRLLLWLAREFADYKVTVKGPSAWRGERRVAEAVRAQVSLREVLLGSDMDAVKVDIDRLQTVSMLMEKESRVASWGVRTVTGPVLAAAGVLAILLLGSLAGTLGASGVTALQYVLVGLLGAAFLYYGLKAVQLTGMANRVWKRAAEYGLILAERRRLRRPA